MDLQLARPVACWEGLENSNQSCCVEPGLRAPYTDRDWAEWMDILGENYHALFFAYMNTICTFNVSEDLNLSKKNLNSNTCIEYWFSWVEMY